MIHPSRETVVEDATGTTPCMRDPRRADVQIAARNLMNRILSL